MSKRGSHPDARPASGRPVARPGDAGRRREQPLDRLAAEVAGDEDEAGTAVIVGPVFKLDRAVRNMLHGMHDDRSAAALDRDQPLDPQQIGAAQPCAWVMTARSTGFSW